jgi:hypothetical protein
MKIFWSWQSDTPGKVGRHFVRDTLAEAIEILRQPKEIEEPSERDAREELHLDHDRKGVSGTPPLAETIFQKIEQAAVFIADVTITGETTAAINDGKRETKKTLINPNVAIEYGYAVHALTDTRILLVQNRYFGEREDLPFDLKHKAGPIQFVLAPDASAQQIATEKARLRGDLVSALRPYVELKAAPKVPFLEQSAAANQSLFFGPTEVLARVGVKDVDEIEYTFAEPRVFYLRLIPTRTLNESLKFSDLLQLVEQRELDTLLRSQYVTVGARNRFGAIAYEPHGTSPTPRAFSQVFTSGEIWGVTTVFFVHRENRILIPATNVENIYKRVLRNFCSVVEGIIGIEPPYQIELGAIGLAGTHLGINLHGISEPIYSESLRVRRTLNDTSEQTITKLVDEFLDKLFDLAGEDRQNPVKRG